MVLSNGFNEMTFEEMQKVDGGLVITITVGTTVLTITGAAIAKAAAAIGTVYIAGHTLGSHLKAAEGR